MSLMGLLKNRLLKFRFAPFFDRPLIGPRPMMLGEFAKAEEICRDAGQRVKVLPGLIGFKIR
jgi:hypothetical protein